MLDGAIKSALEYEQSRGDDEVDDDDDGLSASARACLAQIDGTDGDGSSARLIRASREVAVERERRARAQSERWRAERERDAPNSADAIFVHALATSPTTNICPHVCARYDYDPVASWTTCDSSRQSRRDDERLLPISVWAQPDRILGGRVGQPGDAHVSRRQATRAIEPKVKHQGKAMVPQQRSTNMFALMAHY